MHIPQRVRAALLAVTLAFSPLILPTGSALAQTYNGPGLQAGTDVGVEGVSGESLRVRIAHIINTILSYVSLLAVVVIIIAGLYLILGLGSDSSKETARKIVLYTAIGLLLILFSKVLVLFFISLAE